MSLFAAKDQVCRWSCSPHCRIESLCYLHFPRQDWLLYIWASVFFLGVAGAICLAPFSRTFPSDFFPQWPMPFQFASAASHRCETANCSLCKIRRLFVIQLEVLRLWMRGETAASLRLCLHIVWRQAGVLPACALNWPGVNKIQVKGMMWSNKSRWGHSVCYWAESCVGVVLGVRASV